MLAPLQIGLLLCDDVAAKQQSQHGNYTRMFENGLHAVDPKLVLTPFRCMHGEFPQHPQQYAGYIISGSRYAVYDADAWIGQLMDFVRACWQQRSKTVGICFGHQVLAQALGGKATKAEVGWGFGIHRSQLIRPPHGQSHSQPHSPPPWMDTTEQYYNLVVIHQDQVVELPPGFRTLAQSDFCPHSMILSEGRALGIQGHPEFNAEFCRSRAEERRALIGEPVYQHALESLQNLQTDSARVLTWVAAFLRQRTRVD